MKAAINTQALNSAAKVLTNQAKALSDQGYGEMYFTAQFWSGGKKQNGILRGDVTKISRQVRDYIKSEQADVMNVEIFEEGTDKSIYRRKFSDLYDKEQQTTVNEQKGLGAAEVNELVAKGINESRREDEFNRLNVEAGELREKVKILTAEKDELAAEIKAKGDVERYMGIIGTIFPGLATVFQGTRFANLATTLAGTTDMSGKALPKAGERADEETQSISSMVSEFCDTLDAQEAGIIHVLFMAFEKDRSQMKRAFDFISQTPLPT